MKFVLEDIVRVDSLEECFLGHFNPWLNHPLDCGCIVVDDLDGLVYVDHVTVHHDGNHPVAHYFEGVTFFDDHYFFVSITILRLAQTNVVECLFWTSSALLI